MMKLKTTVLVLVLAMCYSFSVSSQETIEKDQYSVTLSCNSSNETTLCSPFCAFGAEKVTKNLGDVYSFKVNMELGMITFNLTTDNQQSIEGLLTHFEPYGLTPLKIEITRSTGITENWQSNK